jgi:hypothetical protein
VGRGMAAENLKAKRRPSRRRREPGGAGRREEEADGSHAAAGECETLTRDSLAFANGTTVSE